MGIKLAKNINYFVRFTISVLSEIKKKILANSPQQSTIHSRLGLLMLIPQVVIRDPSATISIAREQRAGGNAEGLRVFVGAAFLRIQMQISMGVRQEAHLKI